MRRDDERQFVRGPNLGQMRSVSRTLLRLFRRLWHGPSYFNEKFQIQPLENLKLRQCELLTNKSTIFEHDQQQPALNNYSHRILQTTNYALHCSKVDDLYGLFLQSNTSQDSGGLSCTVQTTFPTYVTTEPKTLSRSVSSLPRGSSQDVITVGLAVKHRGC